MVPGRRTPAWRGGLCTGKIDETGSVTLRMAGQMHADAEQASALVDTDSEGFIAPAIQTFRVLYESETDMRSAYRSGAGAAWKDHDGALDEDIEALPLPGYRAHLVDRWIPALTGVGAKLATTGARVADVGHATYLIADVHPNAEVIGLDCSADAIRQARATYPPGSTPNLRFEQVTADSFGGDPMIW